MTYSEYVLKRNKVPRLPDEDFIQLLLDDAVDKDKINGSVDYFEYKKHLEFLNDCHRKKVRKHGKK